MSSAVSSVQMGGAVERSLAAIELMALADEPLRLSDIASQLGIPKSAAHRLLTTLLDSGWVEQDAQSERYGLTLQIALLGQRLLASRALTDLRQPILDGLAARTKELVRLTAVQNGSLVWVGSARGRRVGLVYEPDMNERIIPYATANGKVWLAQMPREQALKVALDAGLGSSGGGGGPRRISQVRALEAELDLTAERGYGLAREEAEAGVGAVAVPVMVDGAFVGSMSVAAPVARLDEARIEQIVPLLRRAAASMVLAWKAEAPRQPQD